jgi:hypothetical protein
MLPYTYATSPSVVAESTLYARGAKRKRACRIKFPEGASCRRIKRPSPITLALGPSTLVPLTSAIDNPTRTSLDKYGHPPHVLQQQPLALPLEQQHAFLPIQLHKLPRLPYRPSPRFFASLHLLDGRLGGRLGLSNVVLLWGGRKGSLGGVCFCS